MTSRRQEIRRRLARVYSGPCADGSPVSRNLWKYNPKHEMFMGTAHAVETYDRTLLLGRGEDCRALGEFLENCREDIAWLLEHSSQRNRSRVIVKK